jgi:membrane-associated phospholipid phosphatase
LIHDWSRRRDVKTRAHTFCLLSLVTLVQPVVAGEDTVLGDSTVQSRPNLITSFLRDHGDIWSSPFRMDVDDAILWGGVLATTAVLIATDEPVYRHFRDLKDESSFIHNASPAFSQLGEFYLPIGIAGVYCLGGLAFDNQHTLDTGLLGLQAMMHAGIVVQVFKHLFGRTRPFVRNGEDVWYGPRVAFKRYQSGFSAYDAFPSGHTITAFSLATVIAERSDAFWVDATAYSLAGLCGLSRLTERDHWLSDVFMGAALGISIGKLVVKNHERRLEVVPAFGARSTGISLRFTY